MVPGRDSTGHRIPLRCFFPKNLKREVGIFQEVKEVLRTIVRKVETFRTKEKPQGITTS